MVTFTTLGSWNSQGRPDYLATPINVSEDTLQRVASAVPEKQAIDPILIDNSAERNILLTAPATVHISFVWEGAGYKNALAFYTYPIDVAGGVIRPTGTSQWNDTYTLIFPNASRTRSGGQLSPGMRVNIGTFPANTGIGFVLVPNGWDKNTQSVSTNKQMVFSDRQFNTQEFVQTVMLNDTVSGVVFICFEDIMRNFSNCDNDFNDLVIVADIDPVSSMVPPTNTLSPSSTRSVSELVANVVGLQFIPKSSDETALSTGESGDIYTLTTSFDISELSEINRVELLENVNLMVWEHTSTDAFINGDFLEKTFQLDNATIQSPPYILTYTSSHSDDDEKFHAMEVFAHYIVTADVPSNVSIAKDGTPIVQSGATDFSTRQASIFGDPHIRTISGKTYNFPNEPGKYVLLQTDEVKIIGVLNFAEIHKDSPHQILRESTFVQKLEVEFENGSLFIDIVQQTISGNAIENHKCTWERNTENALSLEYGQEVMTLDLNVKGLRHFEGLVVGYLPHLPDHLTEVHLKLKNPKFMSGNGALISEYVHCVD